MLVSLPVIMASISVRFATAKMSGEGVPAHFFVDDFAVFNFVNGKKRAAPEMCSNDFSIFGGYRDFHFYYPFLEGSVDFLVHTRIADKKVRAPLFYDFHSRCNSFNFLRRKIFSVAEA
jgi:hypothetical protein